MYQLHQYMCSAELISSSAHQLKQLVMQAALDLVLCANAEEQ